MTVEKLVKIEVSKRASYVRVIAGEFSRVADHPLCIGAACLELAAVTPFLFLLEAREFINDLLDVLCGSRVATNYIRIGGVAADLQKVLPHCAARNSMRRHSSISEYNVLLI
jgi:NADH-quinone oxidoreductase subunit D